MTTLVYFYPSVTYNKQPLVLNVAYIKEMTPSYDGKEVCYLCIHGTEYATQINLPLDVVVRALKGDDIVGIKLIKV